MILSPLNGSAGGCADKPLAVRVQQIEFREVTRLTALVTVAQRYHICLGIEGARQLWDKLTVHMEDVPFSEFLRTVAPSAAIHVDHGIVHLRGRPAGVRTWLDFPMDFSTEKNLDILLVSNFLLRGSFLAQAVPGSGGMLGDVLGQHEEVGPYNLHHMPVRAILDRLVLDSAGGAAWFVRDIFPLRGKPRANMWDLMLYSQPLQVNLATIDGAF